MLKVIIGLLLALNALVWAWTQNHLAALGWPAPSHRDSAAWPEVPIAPERITPETAEEALAPPPSVAANEVPDQAIDLAHAPADWACWRVGPYALKQQDALQRALPLNSTQLRWQVRETLLPERWVVASERMPQAQALAQLIEQAKAQGIDHRVSNAEVLRDRLVLGTFVRRELAVNTLTQLLDQGWEALSVMRERPPVQALVLELRVADDAALRQAQTSLAAVPSLGQAQAQALRCETDETTKPAKEPAPTPTQ